LLAPDGKAFDWVATVSTGSADLAGTTIHQVVPSDDGAYIAVTGWKNGVLMIDVDQRRAVWAASWQYQPKVRRSASSLNVQVKEVPFDEVDANDASFTPDSKLIYVGGSIGWVYGMKVATGEVVSRWGTALRNESEDGHYIRRVSVSPDGKFVAAGTVPHGLVFLYSTRDGHRCILKHVDCKGIELLSFSPDATRLATYAARQIKIWKVTDEYEKPE
jgi:WD40 repeat protein